MAELLPTTPPCAWADPPTRWVRATTEAELVAARRAADAAGAVLVLGGGSNLVVADAGLPRHRHRGRHHRRSLPTPTTRRAAASWSRSRRGSRGRASSPPRSSAAGSASRRWPASPAGRRDADPERRRLRPGGRADHRLGPRLGPHPERRPHLRQRRLRVRLPHLALQGRPRAPRRPRRHLPAAPGRPSASRCGTPSWPAPSASRSAQRAPLADVRDAVLALRAGKGMVLDEADHDTWSAGSFFTNPIVDADRVPEGAPTWPAETAGSRRVPRG